MSEQSFGAEAVEQNAGFTPMPDPTPAEPDVGSDSSSLREQADKLTETRREESSPAPIDYRDKRGEPIDSRQTVKLERAAADHAAMREAQAKAEERAAEEAVREHVDNIRRGGPGTIEKNANNQQAPHSGQQAYTPAQKEAQQALNEAYERTPYQQWRHDCEAYDAGLVAAAKDPQWIPNVQHTVQAIAQQMQALDQQISRAWAEGQPWQALGSEYEHLQAAYEQAGFVERASALMAGGCSAKVATAIADTETLTFIKQASDQWQASYETALQKHAQDAEDLLNFNMSCFRHGLPELQNCKTPEEINTAIDAIKMNNPSRGQAIANWFAGLNQAAANAVRIREEVAQTKKAQFAQWATQQDNLFRSRNTEFISPETQKTVAHEAFEYLESKGISKEEAIALHDSNELFRSAAGQSVLWDAMRYRRSEKARAGIRDKRAPAEPVYTFKPGVADSGVGREPERLPASFEGNSGLRDAAAILTARRSKRRG